MYHPDSHNEDKAQERGRGEGGRGEGGGGMCTAQTRTMRIKHRRGGGGRGEGGGGRRNVYHPDPHHEDKVPRCSTPVQVECVAISLPLLIN